MKAIKITASHFWSFFMVGDHGKNVDHHGWPTTKNIKKKALAKMS